MFESPAVLAEPEPVTTTSLPTCCIEKIRAARAEVDASAATNSAATVRT